MERVKIQILFGKGVDLMNFYELFKNFDFEFEGKVEKDGTFSGKISVEPKKQVRTEIELIDISRTPKRKSLPKAIPDDNVAETLDKNRENIDLSTLILKKAFGEDFDTEVGKPKVIR